MSDKNIDFEVTDDTKVIVTIPGDNEVKAKLSAFIPLIVGLLGVVGSLGLSFGWWDAIPYTTEEVTLTLTAVVTVASGAYGWWKDNNITKTALKRKEVADQAVPKK